MSNNNTIFIYGYHAVKNALTLYPDHFIQLTLSEQGEKRIQSIAEIATTQHIEIVRQARKKMDELIGHSHHQGIIGTCHQLPTYCESDLPQLLSECDAPFTILILDGVQDPHNLGACLRSANAFGVDFVIAPKDRAVGLTPTVRKVACGAAELTPFIPVTNLARTLRWLQEQSIWLIGTTADAPDAISSIDCRGSIGLIMGAEGTGMRQLTQKHCDYLAHIPMHGDVSSLNVSVSSAICLYELQRQRINR